MHGVVQWRSNLGKPFNVSPVVPHETKKSLQLLDCDWCWPFLNSLDFLRICCYTFCRYDVTQIWRLVSEQLAFWRLQFQSMLLSGSKHVVQVLKVFLKRFAEDQQVVQVNEEDFKQLLTEKTLHEALESCRNSRHPKREMFVLKQPNGVMNAVLCLSASSTAIWLYPDARSRVPFSESSASSICGRGEESLHVLAFRRL